MNDSEKQTIVFIPRNFIEKGTFMGGMFKIRNAIEGGILAVLIAAPVIQLPLSLTVRIIILCMTALPAAMISLIGIGGESISAFLMNALRFLKNRRVIYRIDVNPDPKNKHRIKKPRNKEPKAKKHKHPKKKSAASMTASGQSDKYEGCVSDEISSHDVAISKKKERRQFDTSTKRGIRKQAREDIRILKYENRQLKKAQKQAKRAVRTELKRQKQEEKRRVREENRQKKAEIKATKQADKEREHPASDMNTAPASSKPKKKKRRDMTLEDYLPIEKIANGVIYTTDHRYVKILEIEPINFLLRSTREQQSIIFSFISYLKISPVKLQIKMISKKADINKHLNQAQLELERETDPNCRQLQKDYIQFVRRLSSREAVSRRFFLIFEYEPFNVNRKVEETEILAALETAAQTAKTFLYQCGNEVVSHDNEDEFTTDVLYTLLNRTKSTEVPLPKRINQVLTRYEETGREAEMDAIHINEFIAPESVDFKHSNYVLINGVYHAYLLVPSDGYKPKVAPGWLSLLINAGEGIDVDFYLHKQPKDKIQQRLGQQIRINRSKIKDASDTNADFDDLDSAIRSGYFLKQGLSNNSVNELLDGPTLDASALAGKIQRLHVFFSLLIPDMSHEEKQLLDEALIKTYARKGITHKNESLIDPKHPDQYKEMPILGDVYNVLMESDDTKRLAHILNRLVHGSASSFNQQTNVDLSNKYTVLDISELTGSSDLLTVGMFVALDFVWDKAKENRTEEKAIFVDEVWQLIGASSNRLAAEFVLEIAKIIRAYSGAGIFATQDLNDFFALDDGKYGKGIINNCKTKIILNMEDEEAQRVKNILHLSETEVMNITHFQRGNRNCNHSGNQSPKELFSK